MHVKAMENNTIVTTDNINKFSQYNNNNSYIESTIAKMETKIIKKTMKC